MQLFQKIILIITMLVLVLATAFTIDFYRPKKQNLRYIKEGEVFFAEKSYFKAIGSFENALKIIPNQVDIILKLADAYQKIGKKQEAITALEEILDSSIDDAEQYYSLVMLLVNVYSQDNDFKKALALCDTFLKEKSHVLVSCERASVLLKMGYRREAEGEFQKIIRDNPDDPEAYLRLADVWKKRYPFQATGLLKKFLKKHPNNFRVRLKLANLNLEAKQYRQASTDLSLLYENYPDSILEIAPLLSLSLLRIGEVDRAIEVAEQALQISRNSLEQSPVLKYIRGIGYLRKGNHYEAITDFRDAESTNFPDLYFHLAQAYIIDGKKWLAISALEQAVRNDPRFLKAYHSLIELYIDAGLWSKAEEQIQFILVQFPSNIKLYKLKAQIHLIKKENVKALQAFRKLARLDPESIDGDLGIISVEIMEENYVDALKGASKLLQKYPRNTKLLFLTAKIYYIEKNLEFSLEHLLEALRVDPNYVEASALLCEIRLFQGAPHLAAQEYSRLLKYRPTDRSLWIRLIELYIEMNDFEDAFFTIDQAKKNVSYAFYGSYAKIYMAKKEYEKALDFLKKIPARDVHVLALIGESYRELKRYSDSTESYQSAQAQAAGLYSFDVDVAVGYYMDRGWQKAALVLERYLKQKPEDDLARIFRAAILLVGDQKEEISEELQIVKDNGSHHNWLVQIIKSAAYDFRNQDQFRQAFAEIEKITDSHLLENFQRLLNYSRRMNTNYVPLIGSLVLKEMGYLSTAFRKCNEAVHLLPNDPFLLYLKASLLDELGQEKEAFVLLKELAKSSSSYVYTYQKLGNILLRQNLYLDAKIYFEKALFIKPDLWQAKLGLGKSFLGEGKIKESIEQFEAILKDSTDSLLRLKSYKELALIYLFTVHKNIPLALRFARGGLREKSYDTQLALLMGIAYFQKEEYHAAQKYLFYARNLSPDRKDVYFCLGELYFQQGSTKMAWKALGQCFSLENKDISKTANLLVGQKFFCFTRVF